jgi:putative thioredoxin
MSDKNNPFDSGYGSQFSGGVSYGNAPSRQDTADSGQTSAVDLTPSSAPAAEQSLLGDQGKPEPVLDITTAQFMAEVIEYSRTKPVLVDFWAPWCGPCKQLTPALEAATAKTGGKIRLVKMNIDDHPEIAGQMGVQSIPAVVAFVDGQPKDAFMGAKSEREIEAFIEKIAGPSGPSPLEEALTQADALMAEEAWAEAGHVYGSILQQMPDNRDALAGYGMCALHSGNSDQAKQALTNAGDIDGHQGLEALRAAIDLKEQAESVGDFTELEQAVAENPKDHAARFDLAVALNGAGRKEAAADQLLEIIDKDRSWNDEAAKKQLLQFFEAWGPVDPETLAARRRLSSLLFS